MLYPRVAKVNNKETLVDADQIVILEEHMLKYRIVFLEGIIGMGMGKINMHLVNFILGLDTLSHDPIRLVITSVGGDLDTVFLLYDTLKLIKSPIETYGRLCCSGAAILLAAGNIRYLSPHAKVMLHLPSGAMGGDVRDWEIQHKEMQKYKNKMVDILKECGVKKKASEILRDIDRDFWLEPEEAIEYGLADKIMTEDVWNQWIAKEYR